LDNASAARLLSPWPALAARVDGPVDVRIRGNFARSVWGNGSLSMGHGRVAGLEVSALSLPFDFSFAPDQGYGELSIRESSAAVALGRLTGTARLSTRGATRLRGQL